MNKQSLPYDYKDRNSIISYAKKLKGKTLKKALTINENSSKHLLEPTPIYNQNFKGKGSFGQHLEKDYFLYEPNSDAEPDFLEAGMELKSSPLKIMKSGNFQAKERMVMNIINYIDLVKEPSFTESSFYRKNAFILLVFYLHESGVPIHDLTIHLVDIWELVGEDFLIIEKDWNTIKSKIEEGKAHELSEGDTFYLGACTKGANAQSMRDQPFSDIRAKQRAFSFKQGYVNHIIASISGENLGYYGKLIPEIAKKSLSIEEVVIKRFEDFLDNKKTISDIILELGLDIKETAKSKYALVSKAILGFDKNQEIEEFVKAGITIRTVRLKDNNIPKEHISFPTFKYEEVVEQEWEDSDFYNQISNKFLFVFLRENNNDDYYIEQVKFWNMPAEHIDLNEEMFHYLKHLILEGDIIKEVKEDGKRITNFPDSKYNGITHIRPHARDAADTYPLPFPLKTNGAMEYTKHSFWLNAKYIKEVIYPS